MGNYEQLKAAVSNVIKTNGTQAITGQVLQNTLLTMINSLGSNYQFVGIAATNTNPGTPDQNVFYIAGEGTYTNFANISVNMGELAVLKWNGAWSKQTVKVGLPPNELNISTLYPTNGEGGTNKYTLAGAIAQVPAEYRAIQGLKVSFVNESGDTESWEYNGGSWAVGSFAEGGARKFSELDLNLKSSIIDSPLVGNLINPDKIVKGYYVTGKGSLAESSSFGYVYIPMLGKTITTNIANGAYLAACDKYGNITHVNQNPMNGESAEKSIEYQAGDEYAIISIFLKDLGISAAAEYGNNTPYYTEYGYYPNFKGKELEPLLPYADKLFFAKKDVEIKAYNDNISFTPPFSTVIGEEFEISAEGTAEWSNMMFQFLDAEGAVVQKSEKYIKGEKRVIVSTSEIVGLILYVAATTEGRIEVTITKKGELSKLKEEVANPTINGTSIIDGTITSNKLSSEFVSPGKNLYNPNDADVLIDKIISNDKGNISTLVDYNVTGFIEFTEDMGNLVASNDGVPISGGALSALYDSNKSLIKTIQNSVSKGVFTWEDRVKFLRVSAKREKLQIEVGTSPTSYEEYKFQLNDNLIPKEKEIEILSSSLGNEAINTTAVSLSDSETLSISDFPRYIEKGNVISLSAEVSTFDQIVIGKGYKQFMGGYFVIDNTNVSYKKYSTTEENVETVAHGVTIEDVIKVSIYSDANLRGHLILQSKNHTFTHIFNDFGYMVSGDTFVKSIGSTLNNLKLNAGNSDFRFPVWAFGDSYFGINDVRWPGIMKSFGYFNLMLNGLAGQVSTGAYTDLLKCFKFGTPKYLLWCLGMNDNEDNFIRYFDIVKGFCEDKGIIFIGATIPTVPTRNREVISQHVRDSGARYIDFYKAVGTNSDGIWYDGYLDSDGVHPTNLGAKALAMQVLIDFPELMQYGITTELLQNSFLRA